MFSDVYKNWNVAFLSGYISIKRKEKKVKKIVSLLLMIIVMSSISYAYSEDFKYMLDTLEISEKNTRYYFMGLVFEKI